MSEESDLTMEEIEEARAEEEFISAPEDRVNNPLVPAGAGTVISSGDFAHEDFTGGSDLINNETNMKGEIVGNQEGSIFDKPKAATKSAPAEDGASIFAKKKEVKEEAAAPAPAPVAQPTIADVAAGAAPKKKSKVGLIVTLCVIAVLLIGGGVAAFLLLMMHESPDTLVNDAVAKIYTSENLYATTTTDFESQGVKGNLNLDIAKSGDNFKVSGVVKIDDAKIKFDAIQYKSEAFIKLDGIDELPIDEIMKDNGSESNNGVQAKMMKSIFKYIGEGLDDVWIKVDPSLLTGLSGETHSCGLGINDLLEGDLSKMKDAYKDNAFVVRDEKADIEEKDGVKYIKVKIDQKKSKDFAKAMFGDKMENCADTESKDEKDSSYIIGVKPWSHDLDSVKFKNGDKEYELKFDSDKKEEISKPENAKSLMTVLSDVESALKKGLNEYAEEYTRELCKEMYGSYGSAYVETCVDTYLPQMKKQFQNIDLNQLFGPMLQGIMGGSVSES